MAGISKERRKELEQLESDTTKLCTDCKEVKPLFEFIVQATGRKLASSRCLDCHSVKELRRRHGVTLKDYDELLEKQNGKCKICGTETPGGRGRFHVDHDHLTSKIRGLLCHKCNTFLGLANDNIETLASAIQYLVNSRK